MKVIISNHLHTTTPSAGSEKKPCSIHSGTSPDLPKGWDLRILARNKCEPGETYPRCRFLGLDFADGKPIVSVWV